LNSIASFSGERYRIVDAVKVDFHGCLHINSESYRKRLAVSGKGGAS
jgi:hypothetical protein